MAQSVVNIVNHDFVDGNCRYCGANAELLEIKANIATLKQNCAAIEGRIDYTSTTLVSDHALNCTSSDCYYKDFYDSIVGKLYYFESQINKIDAEICALKDSGEIDIQKINEIKAEIEEIDDWYIGGDVILADIAALDSYLDAYNDTIVVIPDGTTYWSGEYKNGRLTSVTIPVSVTEIRSWALEDCCALKEIIFEGTVAQWNAITKEYNWNNNTGTYTVYCTDGQITKDGTITYKK